MSHGSAAPFHPDLQRVARWLPEGVVASRGALLAFRAIAALTVPLQRVRPPAGVTVVDRRVDGLPGAPAVPVRTYTADAAAPRPALLWIHGGGYVLGGSSIDDVICGQFASRLGLTVVSVDYRLAPEHPFPAALHDCAAAYRHLLAGEPGIDPARIVIGGASAGGGLAAALALYLRDEGLPPPALQLLVYPMLDDRTLAAAQPVRMWNGACNRFGWASYLGGQDPERAAPARRTDVAGLAPAWIGVGTHDLFYEEDISWARRLQEAGVPVDLQVVEGAFHAFDMIAASAPVSRRFFDAQVQAMARAVTRGS
jgi:acetyl esterase/lipase